VAQTPLVSGFVAKFAAGIGMDALQAHRKGGNGLVQEFVALRA
jgi:hypothetical protein